MGTWLEDFHARSDLNKYEIASRTRGGIGYRLPGGEIELIFVGHAVHNFERGKWEAIGLVHENGQWSGSDYGWNGFAVTYRRKVLFQPNSISFNGIVYPLTFFLDADNRRMVAYIPNIGEYVVQFTESGVKEILTIPEPLEGELVFDVQHHNKPAGVRKSERRIINRKVEQTEQTGNVFTLSLDMVYPVVIDPDYAADSADGIITGVSAVYATARSTAVGNATTGVLEITNSKIGSDYYIYRSFLKFLTSGIPDSDVVSQVNLTMVATNDDSITDFDVQIVKQDWSALDPISGGTQEALYDGCLSAAADNSIWRNTSGMSVNTQYASGSFEHCLGEQNRKHLLFFEKQQRLCKHRADKWTGY